jgi:cohesin loading factor subunit SCC2
MVVSLCSLCTCIKFLLLYLQVFCVLLFGNAGIRAKDAIQRGTSVDLLGLVAARLKQDAVSCSKENLWILQELQGKVTDDDSDDELQRKNCSVCGKGKGSKVMVTCDGCNRWFHGDCIGVTKHDILDRGWLCHCCLCRKQIDALYPDKKSQVNGNKLSKGSQQADMLGDTKNGVAVIQQIVLNYLHELAGSDSTANYARR